MAGTICDVCNKDDIKTGVASSTLGAVSLAYCSVCNGVGAEPTFLIKGVIEMAGGEKNIRPDLVKYDKETDNYYHYTTNEMLPLGLNDGTSFDNRDEIVKYMVETYPQLKSESKR